MRIVGGIYKERSIFPDRDVIYGSGGRAAAALSLMNPDITLTSFVGENKRHAIEYYVKEIWKQKLDAYAVPEIVSFTYYHGLSSPIIRPERLPIDNAPEIRVKDDIILQFGMLEGKAVVNGRRVIYDPQNPESPEHFNANGSVAQELAYVLNWGEAYKLTGQKDTARAAEILLDQPHVVVVVVKLGAYGAKVYTAKTTDHIAPYAYGQCLADRLRRCLCSSIRTFLGNRECLANGSSSHMHPELRHYIVIGSKFHFVLRSLRLRISYFQS